jgi:hypothetical protein
MFICNAPSGGKKNFWWALLVNFRSATHICKNGNCTSISGTPEVHWTSRAEFLEAFSLVGAFFILFVSLAAHCQFHRFFCTSGVLCCSSMSNMLLLLVNKLKKFILFHRRHRKIWNQLPSASFGLIFMSEGQNETHLWWHGPFKPRNIENCLKFIHKKYKNRWTCNTVLRQHKDFTPALNETSEVHRVQQL